MRIALFRARVRVHVCLRGGRAGQLIASSLLVEEEEPLHRCSSFKVRLLVQIYRSSVARGRSERDFDWFRPDFTLHICSHEPPNRPCVYHYYCAHVAAITVLIRPAKRLQELPAACEVSSACCRRNEVPARRLFVLSVRICCENFLTQMEATKAKNSRLNALVYVARRFFLETSLKYHCKMEEPSPPALLVQCWSSA